MRKLSLLILVAIVPSLAAQERAAAPQPPAGAGASAAGNAARAVSGRVMRAHLEFLADDALEGRAPGTRGGDLAASYLATQFMRLGLEPAGDSGSYHHRVPIISLDPSPTLTIPQAGAPRALAYRTDYVLWSMHDSASVAATGELVFVGYGIVAPEQQWNDYAGTDVKGKIVVALVNDPGLQDSTIFRGKVLTYYGRWTYKLEEAERQGAAGILLIHTTESATYPWGTVSSSWTGPQVRVARPAGPLKVAGWLTSEAAAALVGGSDSLDGLMASAARKGFRAVPLAGRAEARVESEIAQSETFNVLGRFPGRGAHAADAVIIGGHYDHLGVGTPVDGDSIYNGAVDNASGTAAVLAMAEALVTSGVRPSRSIVFMGFGAEESGLLGSTAFAARPSIPLRNIAAVLNVDGVNVLGPTRDIAALGLDQSSLGRTFAQAAAAEKLRVSTNEDALLKGYFFRSDHFPFVRAGVPALSLQAGNDFVGRPADFGQKQEAEYNANRYHQPSDEVMPGFRYEGAEQAMRVILRVALAVAEAPAQPTWSEGSEFREAGEKRIAP
ncbi:MAG TPA: M20/M25/M40 family metallo-hydrolase [Gemmatimonadales bacterium]|nr:M20/M25/M40 family metallo-hydrolase [Gemmatimonadales bacterium]